MNSVPLAHWPRTCLCPNSSPFSRPRSLHGNNCLARSWLDPLQRPVYRASITCRLTKVERAVLPRLLHSHPPLRIHRGIQYSAIIRRVPPDLLRWQWGTTIFQTPTHIIIQCPLYQDACRCHLLSTVPTLSTNIIFSTKAGGPALGWLIEKTQARVRPGLPEPPPEDQSTRALKAHYFYTSYISNYEF